MKAKNEVAGPLINEKIRFGKLQVISHDGKNLGIITREDALRIARQSELDLVLISETGGEGSPVAKIMDFGKSLYEKKKQQNDAKKNQKIIQIKELKMRPKIGEHDYETKINQGVQFLKEGKFLKVTLMFRGREAATRDERGEEIFAKVDQSFEVAGLTKIGREKDSKAPQLWSRVYFLKK